MIYMISNNYCVNSLSPIKSSVLWWWMGRYDREVSDCICECELKMVNLDTDSSNLTERKGTCWLMRTHQ